MKPFFSIIIPTLNEETHLPRLLTSILAQTNTDFEVIVSDAASPDATRVVARTFIDKFSKRGIYLSVISKHERNVSRTRNIGATKARGIYLVFFDADVQISTDCLQTLRSQLSNDRTDACALWAVSGTFNFKDHIVAAMISGLQVLSLILKNPFIFGHCMIVKRNVFNDMEGFDETILIAEDYDLSKRLFDGKYTLKVYRTPKVIVSMRRYRKVGHFTMVYRYIKMIVHTLRYGTDHKKGLKTLKVDYPMGGHAHR
jgi:glycosyltransferase involved in cell wall biosynthesis